MILTTSIKESIDSCVLCWLATSSAKEVPNVSPKEIFTHYGDDQIIIANIASPQTIKNIKQNKQVCISFIDILVQKGYQLKGNAEIKDPTHDGYQDMKAILLEMTGGQFPFSCIIVINVEQSKPIIAPRYLMYPDTMESDQIESAKRAYDLK